MIFLTVLAIIIGVCIGIDLHYHQYKLLAMDSILFIACVSGVCFIRRHKGIKL